MDIYLMHQILIVLILKFLHFFGNILGIKLKLHCYLQGVFLLRCQHDLLP